MPLSTFGVEEKHAEDINLNLTTRFQASIDNQRHGLETHAKTTRHS